MMPAKMAINKILIKQAVIAMQANARIAGANTKTRGEVSGGGRKPWKQKGTGRARVGSSRSPIWVGGGITFGPSSEKSFKQLLPKKMAQKAKAELWRLCENENRVLVVPNCHLAEPKTKLAVKLLKTINPKGKTLLITKDVEPELILATGNIPNVNVLPLDQVSILDLAYYQTLVMERVCYEQIYTPVKGAKKTAQATKSTITKELD